MSKQKRSEWTSEGKLKGLSDTEIRTELEQAKQTTKTQDDDKIFEVQTAISDDVVLIETEKLELLTGEAPINLESKTTIKLEGKAQILLEGKEPERLEGKSQKVELLEGKVTELLTGRKRISIEGGTVKISSMEEKAPGEG